MRKILLSLIFFTIILLGSESKFIENSQVHMIYCEDINKSLLEINQTLFSPIIAIDKIWFETLNVNSSRFVTHFYTKSEIDKRFLQNIPVKNKQNEYVEIFYQDNPDCSESRYILVKKKDDIYLLTAKRMKNFPTPKYESSNQKITIYKLTKSSIEIMEEPIFFNEYLTFETEKSICDGNEIKELFKKIILNQI